MTGVLSPDFNGYSSVLDGKSNYIRNFCLKPNVYNSLFISIWNNEPNFGVQKFQIVIDYDE